MVFDRFDLQKVARLARLALNEDEIDHFAQDLERIVTFVAQLNELDVEGVKPMSHAGDRTLTLREDNTHEVVGRKSLESSQGYDDGLIQIPKILD